MPASLSARSVVCINVDLNSLFGFGTVPTAGHITWAVPLGEKFEADLIGITLFPGTTLGIDAGGMTVAVDHRYGAAGASAHALVAATDVTVGLQVAKTTSQLWRGRQAMVAGEYIDIVSATDGTLSTAAIGASIMLEMEITERSGV